MPPPSPARRRRSGTTESRDADAAAAGDPDDTALAEAQRAALALTDRFLSASGGADAEAALVGLVRLAEGDEGDDDGSPAGEGGIGSGDVAASPASAAALVRLLALGSGDKTDDASHPHLDADDAAAVRSLLGRLLRALHPGGGGDGAVLPGGPRLSERGPALAARLYAALILGPTTAAAAAAPSSARLVTTEQRDRLLTALLSEPAPPGRLVAALAALALDDDDDDDAGAGDHHRDGTAGAAAARHAARRTTVRIQCLDLLHHLAALPPGLAAARRLVARQLLEAATGPLARYLLRPPPPPGAHRHGDDDEEAVEAHVMRLALVLSTWPAVAKNWVFQGVPDHLLIQQRQRTEQRRRQRRDADPDDEDDDVTLLTHGPLWSRDWLQLVRNLLQHADASLASLLVLESPVLLPQLTALLDLRMGARFRCPQHPRLRRLDATRTSAAATITKADATAAALPAEKDGKDDLEDLLLAGSRSAAPRPQPLISSSSTGSARPAAAATAPVVDVPYLTRDEESTVEMVLEILGAVLEHEAIRRTILQQPKHRPLVAFLWELGLLIRPDTATTGTSDVPPPIPALFACAVPSYPLQQQALQLLARHCCETRGNSDTPGDSSDASSRQSTAERLDRLLYVACTGGARGSASGEVDASGATGPERGQARLHHQLGLSQSALHCFRRLLTPEQRNELILYSLAPPPRREGDDDSDNTKPSDVMAQSTTATSGSPVADVSMVARLLNTLVEELVLLVPSSSASATATPPSLMRLSGATGALMILLSDEVSRTMLLRLATPLTTMAGGADTEGVSLLELLLQALLVLHEQCQADAAANTDNCGKESGRIMAVVLLRFVAHWVTDAPSVTFQLLQSPSSTLVLPILSSSLTTKVMAQGRDNLVPLTYLLLGLVLNNMGRRLGGKGTSASAGNKEIDDSQCGGWTKSSIFQLLSSQGLSNVTLRLEAFKSRKVVPWCLCVLEWDIWQQWYGDCVLIIRKRLIEELTSTNRTNGHAGPDAATDSSRDSETAPIGANAPSSSPPSSLQALLSQQAQELDTLNQQLSELRNTVSFQEKQMSEWKKRLESNPTQLDEMLNEYANKIIELERENITLSDNLKHRDSKIEGMLNDLEESRGRYNESRQECDSLREELTALSHAYSNLETEYQQRSSQMSGAPAEGQESNAIPKQQVEGEVSHQSPSVTSTSSSEVAMLRADNARLRQDAHAADEWMAMAVEKMNEMGSQNANLLQQVMTLQKQIETVHVSKKEKGDVVENEKLSMNDTQLRPETDTQYSNRILALEKSLQEEKDRCQGLLDFEQQCRDLSEQLVTERLRLESLEQQLERANSLEQNAPHDLDRTAAELEHLKKELHNAQQEINLLKGQQQGSQPENQDLLSVNELLEAKEQFAAVVTRDQEELYKYETRIRELEARLDGGLGKYTMEDIRKRDEDIAELQKANNEAQEWMSNAVQQHQLLSGQVNSLLQENNALSTRVRELSERNKTQPEDGPERGLREEVDDLRREVASRDATIEQLHRELESSVPRDDSRLRQLDAQVTELTKVLEDQKNSAMEVIKQWGESYAALEKERDELLSRLNTTEDHNAFEIMKAKLEQRIDRLESERLLVEKSANETIAGWQESFHALELNRNDLLIRLEALEKDNEVSKAPGSMDTQTTSRRCSDHENEISKLEKQIEEIKANRDEILNQYKQLQKENEDSSRDSAYASHSYNALETEKKSLEVQLESLSKSSSEEAELLRFQLTTAENRLTEASSVIEELKSKTATLQVSVDELNTILALSEARERDAEHSLAALSSDLKDSQDELCRLKSAVTEREELFATLSSERDRLRIDLKLASEKAEASKDASNGVDSEVLALRERVELLEKDKSELAEELASASDVVSEWETSYAALEAENKNYQSRLEAILSTKDTSSHVDDEAKELAALTIVDLETRIKHLEEQHAHEEENSQEAIAHWQEEVRRVEAERDTLLSNVVALEAEKKEFEGRFVAAEQTADQKVEHLQQELSDLRSRFDSAIGEKSSLQEQLASADACLRQQETINAELLSKISSLEDQLVRVENDADEAIQEWQTSLHALEAERNELLSQINVLESVSVSQSATELVELTSRAAALEDELAKAYESVAEQKGRYDDILSKLQILESKHTALCQHAGELESARKDLADELHETRNKYDSVVAQLKVVESSTATKLDDLDELRTQLSKTESSLKDLEVKYKDALDMLTEKHDLHQTLSNQLAESNGLTESLRLSADDLRMQLNEKESTILELKNQIEQLEKDRHTLNDELQAKESTCDELQAQLSRGKEAADFIRQENASLKLAATSLTELQVTLDGVQNELRVLQDEATTARTTIDKIEAEKRFVQAEFDAFRSESESIIDQWRVSLEETQSALQNAESNLNIANEEIIAIGNNADLAIDEWESRCKELDARVSELMTQLDAAHYSKTIGVPELESTIKRLESDLDRLCNENSALRAENERLSISLKEREQDLNEAINAVEFQITNTVSDRATAVVSEALRRHVDELRSSLQATQKECLAANEARVTAEDEANQLRDDLAALLGMHSTPENRAEIRRRALSRKEEIRHDERSEILELKDALAEALDRLEASQEQQSLTEERYAKVSLQASMYEQELITARRDLVILTETLDEVRQAESSQRETMEYRTTELQDECQLLRKEHASQLASLRNELGQVAMERDRLLKALKESERQRDDFFQVHLARGTAATPGTAPGDGPSELQRLRLEKTHLLNSIATEAAAAERRLREARAVAQSTAEAEMIVERDRRLSAEKSLAELRGELMELRERFQASVTGGGLEDPDAADYREALRREIQALHEQNQSLVDEVARLEQALAVDRDAARAERRRLAEELRDARARCVRLEGASRREAEFHAELERLRRGYGGKDGGGRRQGDLEIDPAVNTGDDCRRDAGSVATAADVSLYYDETMKLNERLAQDRATFLQLVEQHDRLLALLARDNILRRSVLAALERAGGRDAVDQALADARERALLELGMAVEFDEVLNA